MEGREKTEERGGGVIRKREVCTKIFEREKSLSLVHRAEVKLVGIIQIINVERCWQLPLTMMQ